MRPQYSYSRAGVAWNPNYDRAEVKRRLQLLRLMKRTRSDQILEHASKWLETADITTTFIGLWKTMALVSPEDGKALFDHVARRDVALARLVRRATENERREGAIIRRRETVTDPELRFFLAILLNVSDRAEALRLIGEKFSQRASVDSFIHWVQELSRQPSPIEKGTSALGFEVDDVVLAALRGLLEEKPFDAIAHDVATIVRRPLTESEHADLAALCDAFRKSDMFGHVLGGWRTQIGD